MQAIFFFFYIRFCGFHTDMKGKLDKSGCYLVIFITDLRLISGGSIETIQESGQLDM